MSQQPGALISKCATRVANGEADLILDNRDSLTAWLLDRAHPSRCQDFTPSPAVTISAGAPVNPVQIFLAINRDLGFDFYSNVQSSLAWLRQQAPVDVMGAIYQRELRRGEGCPARDGVADTTRISFSSQGGVFVLTGGLTLAALLVSVFEAYVSQRGAPRDASVTVNGGKSEADDEGLLTDGDILRKLLQEVKTLRAAAAEQTLSA